MPNLKQSDLLGVMPVEGWVLITRDEAAKDWHLAWLEVFSTRRAALELARDNKWSAPFKAVRGNISTSR